MVRLALLNICLLAVWLVDGAALADASGWQLVSRTAQGQIDHQPVAGSAYPRIRIRTTFAAAPVEVYGLINDYNHFADFVPNVVASRVIYVNGGTQWVFHHLKFAGPVADRVYLLESNDSGSRPHAHRYRVEWHLSDRDFPEIELSGGVRPQGFSGHWLIEPGNLPGTSRAEYLIHSEPGGLVPAWLVTRMSDRYVRQLIDAIRQKLAGTIAGPDSNEFQNLR